MAHMRHDCKPNHFFCKTLRSGRPAYSVAVLQAGMFSDDLFPALRTVRKYFSDAFRKLLNIVLVKFSSSLSGAFITSLSDFAIRQTLGLSLCECIFLNQQPLSFISTSSPTEF